MNGSADAVLGIGDRRSATLRGLTFTPELKRIFEGGTRLRDDPEFPGRKYFLAHAARELRRDLHKHVATYVTVAPIKAARRGAKRPRLTSETASYWVTEVSPSLRGFADADARADHSVTISLELAARLDPYMQSQADVSESLRRRMRDGYEALGRFVPLETLEAAVVTMHKIDPDKYTHVRPLDEEFSDAEVTTLWDLLEATLFDLFGANAWTYQCIDLTADMLNNL